MIITQEECQRRLMKELEKRTGRKDMPNGSAKTILEEMKMAQQILNENPSWGYEIIIKDAKFTLKRRSKSH